MRYSIQDLTALRTSATLNPCIEFYPEPLTREDRVLPDPNAVLSFRKELSGSDSRNAVKFVQDMDVPIAQIVHVFCLSRSVGWPHLKTFCKKVVGIEPLDVRMMRRKTPCEARLIFHSSEEAREFLAKVPERRGLHGSCPRFELESNVPTNRTGVVVMSSKESRCVDIVQLAPISAAVVDHTSSESDEEIATAVVRGEDDCCSKGNKISSDAFNTPVFPAVVAEEGWKSGKGKGKHFERPVSQGRGMKKGPFKSVTAICVGHMPASSMPVGV